MYIHKKTLLLTCAFAFTISTTQVFASSIGEPSKNESIENTMKITSATTAEVINSNGEKMIFDFYGNNIVRIFFDKKNRAIHDPIAKPEAKILVNNARKSPGLLKINGNCVSTDNISVRINPETFMFEIENLKTGKVVLKQEHSINISDKSTEISFMSQIDEYFFGGGIQNGRFSHRGTAIAIENTNSWTDGGVCSPAPYYWSTEGYGIMWYTFAKGVYDFGAKKKNTVTLKHDTDYLDIFVMIDNTPSELLNDYYQLTGNPVLLPKFGFYEGHLNAYNRDFWKQSDDSRSVLFEDGKHYRESQTDNGGIKESLNGEKNNYQFSARAVIDRYAAHDMPLGWILPNDGYGAGYGQTKTLDGNIANLKAFGDYAREHGVQIGLWTQSDLHPVDGIDALLQRDIVKEVRDAGVRVLKTDVAWVGEGYSFGLNGVADVANIMPKYGNNARPFIISLDGWAGTQRYAGVWSGDQTGGKWEYIRFHIPTYICSGLTGMPNITSDMDGIFGGQNTIINARDFEWKAFTPMQLNMDGWGSNAKYPQIFGEPTTSINRWYLKLKSELLPYAYTIAKESVDGKPMIRAMFLDYPNTYTLGKSTQYQYLYGPSFLVAPIYQETAMKTNGDDIRNGIYLPTGTWIDYFTGEKYTGGRIINNFEAPIWKLPVFVKDGSIIPMNNPNNNPKQVNNGLRIVEIYPGNQSQFNVYDDDGVTEAYRNGKYATTLIEQQLIKDKAYITINATKGDFDGFVKEKQTELRINMSAKPKGVIVKVGKTNNKLKEVSTIEAFNSSDNVFFYNPAPEMNKFATQGSDFAKVSIKKNPQLFVKLAKTDITTTPIKVIVRGCVFDVPTSLLSHTGTLTAPLAIVDDANCKPYTLKPTWQNIDNADYYEIEFNGENYSTIKDCSLLFEDLKAETDYTFKIRSVNKDGVSDWSSFSAKTKSDPLEFAIRGIKATTTCENQGGMGVNKLFDFDPASTWHSKWGKGEAVPFTMNIDLKSINTVDRLQYVPREDAGNGTITSGTISTSLDGNTWSNPISFVWNNNGNAKDFKFTEQPTIRYVKINVDKANNNFASGVEMYIFKVPETLSYLPGDINNDRLVDYNDYTSYMNYVGLRQGDGDFEGYVSNGDLNKNGLIDAYDVSVVATSIGGGEATKHDSQKVAGKISLVLNKKSYSAGETIEISVMGTDLIGLNAISFGLPYNDEYEYVAVEPVNMKNMENISRNRIHKNGIKAVYPMFVNVGKQETINGNAKLFVIKLKAKSAIKTFNLKAVDGFLVDRNLDVLKF